MFSTDPSPSNDGSDALPAAVEEVLASIPDSVFGERLRLVQLSATRAMRRLRDIDLGRIEHLASSGEGSDLALWEEVAPAVGISIGDVNGLLATIQKEFPRVHSQAAEDDFDLAFGGGDESQASGPLVATTFEEKAQAAEKAVQGIEDVLRFEVSRFGKRVRNPTVVADRWNLLIDLQEFRGKCRAAIGELIFSSCNVFEPIARPSVVPDYEADLKEGLWLRQAWITLTRAVGPLNARLQLAGPEQQRPLLLAIQRELEHYCVSLGYAHMRAGDKRFVLQFRRELAALFSEKRWGKPAAMLVEGFSKFLDSMAVLNRREVLMNHDREAFAECGTLLEQASQHLEAGAHRVALERLQGAVNVAMRLYGRDRYLDDYLVLRMRWPIETLVPSGVESAVEELRTCLAESGTHAPGTHF